MNGLAKLINYSRHLLLNKPKIAGFDISSVPLAICMQLAKKGNSTLLSNFATTTIPEKKTQHDGSIAMVELPGIIRQLKEQAKIRKCDSSLATPGIFVNLKPLQVPYSDSEEQLENLVWNAAQKEFEDINEELYMDYYETEHSEKENVKVHNIMLVAAHKKPMQETLSAFSATHTTCRILDVDFFTLEQATNFSLDLDNSKITATINVNPTSLTFITLKGQERLHTYYHHFEIPGLIEAMRDLASKLTEYPFEKKESLNKDPFTTLISQINAEIGLAISGFNKRYMDLAINDIQLCGFCALIPGIEQALFQQTNIQTNILNPFRNIEIASHLNRSNIIEMGPACVMAFGLALRNINYG